MSQGITFRESAVSGKHKRIANEIADTLYKNGIKTAADIIDYQYAARHPVYAKHVGAGGREIAYRMSKEVSSNSYEFETTGNILINSFTTKLVNLIQENYGQDAFAKTALDMIFPDSTYESQTILVDVYAAPGGATDAYTYGSAVTRKNRVGNRTYAYEGAPYRNFISFDENEITFLRALGDPQFGARGIIQRITMAILQAKTLNYNRKQLIKATVFNNQIAITPQLNGVTQLVNYQIPTYNLVSSYTSPGSTPNTTQWATYHSTTGQWVFNAAANPITDLQYYLNIYQPWLTRTGQLNNCKLIMSPVTQFIITNHPTVLALFRTNLASPAGQFSTYQNFTVDNIIKSLIPGFNGEIIIDRAAYLTENSDVTWSANGFTNTPVGQNFFLPPGQILFAVDPIDSPLGDFVYTPAVQNGGVENATPGEWIITQDLTNPLIPNGVLQPSVQVAFGFAGGLRVMHPESTFIGNFVNLTT